MKIADYHIQLLTTEHFRLDGGAMFGSVPKTLWQRSIPADDKNRILLACNILLLEGVGKKILVDVGMGRKWTDKDRDIYGVDYLNSKPLEEQIADPTDVLLSHLHFDHAGGLSKFGPDNKPVRVYPNAMHWVSARNLEQAKKPGVRERASYLAEHVQPLQEGPLKTTEDGQQIYPGITVHQVHGHTPGLHIIKIGEGKGAMVFPSDLIPTAHHLAVPYVMGYDLCAATSMEEKEKFLEQAITNEWRVVFEHDVDTPCGILGRDEKGRPVVKEKIDLPRVTA